MKNISMTDNIKMTDNLYEFRKLVLKDLMKMGYKYIVRDKNGIIYAYSCRPNKREKEWVFDMPSGYDTYEDISLLSRIFTDIEWEDVEPFKIPYTNWKEVPVDTPVVYTNGDCKNYIRHFYKYDEENDRVFLYANGRTSLTEKGIIETCPEKVSIYGEEELGEEKELSVLMV